MTNKIIITVYAILTLWAISCDNKTRDDSKPTSDNIFATLEYDKVIAYNYDGEGDIEIIDKTNGQLADKIKKRIVLDKSQVIRITNDLCDKSTYGGDIAACFDPHLGIVFYKTNKHIAYISVCLDCNYLVSSIKIPNSDNGFSEKGIKRIVDFEKEIGY